MTASTMSPPSSAVPTEPSRSGEGRTVVTLSPPVADAVRRMAAQMDGVGSTEVVRRGLMILDLFLSLSETEELVVRDKETGQCERLRFAWETF